MHFYKLCLVWRTLQLRQENHLSGGPVWLEVAGPAWLAGSSEGLVAPCGWGPPAAEAHLAWELHDAAEGVAAEVGVGDVEGEGPAGGGPAVGIGGGAQGRGLCGAQGWPGRCGGGAPGQSSGGRSDVDLPVLVNGGLPFHHNAQAELVGACHAVAGASAHSSTYFTIGTLLFCWR